jgi:hypothetical protein
MFITAFQRSRRRCGRCATKVWRPRLPAPPAEAPADNPIIKRVSGEFKRGQAQPGIVAAQSAEAAPEAKSEGVDPEEVLADRLAVVLASSPDHVEAEFRGMKITEAEGNAAQITLSISRQPIEEESVPMDRFTKDRFPGLFR